MSLDIYRDTNKCDFNQVHGDSNNALCYKWGFICTFPVYLFRVYKGNEVWRDRERSKRMDVFDNRIEQTVPVEECSLLATYRKITDSFMSFPHKHMEVMNASGNDLLGGVFKLHDFKGRAFHTKVEKGKYTSYRLSV